MECTNLSLYSFSRYGHRMCNAFTFLAIQVAYLDKGVVGILGGTHFSFFSFFLGKSTLLLKNKPQCVPP